MFDMPACPFRCPIMGLCVLGTYKRAIFEKLLFCAFHRFLLMLLRHSPMHLVVTKKGRASRTRPRIEAGLHVRITAAALSQSMRQWIFDWGDAFAKTLPDAHWGLVHILRSSELSCPSVSPVDPRR
jgi:hypothetical protein